MLIISQVLLYLCLSITFGSFLLSLIPKNYRPDVTIPKNLLLIVIVGIPVFSFIPVMQIILYLFPLNGVVESFQSVLLTFELGKSWVFIFILSIILFFFVLLLDYRNDALYSFFGIVLTFLSIIGIGWSSHASSIDSTWGFLSDTTHLTAVSIWVGILIVISWFSNDASNWLNFLKWFTPLAILCFVSTGISGLLLMSFVVDDYVSSWMIPYGQALLIKHLLIIPVLFYALLNGLFIKREIKKNNNFDPRPWAKVESLILLFIFSATAVLGQHSPPKETVISGDNVSKLFTIFSRVPIQENTPLYFVALNFSSVMFILLAVLFLVMTILSFVRKAPVVLSLLMGVLLVVCLYLSIMLSVA
ncbi:putative copper resistance protein D [Ureibacillus xyleni]|uniref:Putative copper resistance protein D n=1 Tax=Ureibacillus xyleni TaxID=614648 RepID=A0A285SSZ8_9BACL|nr:CopD family protein [Ureibacillus xyleni]SOC11458.1 putative copper resistance protein D [Ureibacillus xyleni]